MGRLKDTPLLLSPQAASAAGRVYRLPAERLVKFLQVWGLANTPGQTAINRLMRNLEDCGPPEQWVTDGALDEGVLRHALRGLQPAPGALPRLTNSLRHIAELAQERQLAARAGEAPLPSA
ncbi:MAG TPA: hypothetical protein VFU47_15985 [Armatimonadota bacterium]|nr:hypothetical protein [Armatimonadota bacterium]